MLNIGARRKSTPSPPPSVSLPLRCPVPIKHDVPTYSRYEMVLASVDGMATPRIPSDVLMYRPRALVKPVPTSPRGLPRTKMRLVNSTAPIVSPPVPVASTKKSPIDHYPSTLSMSECNGGALSLDLSSTEIGVPASSSGHAKLTMARCRCRRYTPGNRPSWNSGPGPIWGKERLVQSGL